MNKDELLNKYAQRTVSSEEQLAFQQWIATLTPVQLTSLLDEYGDIVANMPDLQVESNPTLLAAVHEAIDLEAAAPVRRMNWRWVAAAAVLLLTASMLVFYLLVNTNKPVTPDADQPIAEIQPGKSGATLRLANGKTIILDSLANGVIAHDNGAETVLADGKLVYRAEEEEAATGFNTMYTPKGRQFNVVLADGTVVWLNAASSITYPTAFKGKLREVSIHGEAYFEVAKNPKMPFVVHAGNAAKIEVLGTHFNVEAYENNETLNATLLEGSLKVNGTLIKPGQQAQVTNVVRVVNNADTNQVMAWKHGLFNFEDAKLYDVMKQLERWYDIEVVYEKGVPNITFGGEMTKNIPLSGLLLALEKSDIHFRVEGRKLVVLP